MSDKSESCQYLSTLDFTFGFYQVDMHLNFIANKTAFTVEHETRLVRVITASRESLDRLLSSAVNHIPPYLQGRTFLRSETPTCAPKSQTGKTVLKQAPDDYRLQDAKQPPLFTQRPDNHGTSRESRRLLQSARGDSPASGRSPFLPRPPPTRQKRNSEQPLDKTSGQSPPRNRPSNSPRLAHTRIEISFRRLRLGIANRHNENIKHQKTPSNLRRYKSKRFNSFLGHSCRSNSETCSSEFAAV
ncbi:hypothetical protein ILUMI_26226 [Ignelater luminosus]|uniref:Uncharacterized protein n=1 Tax=Ignelater luminosus TaxID=2038154 RepID=A0A8K0C4I7_IGNLU|nr:hypothetical protein ILUMI_26226 [Ignelater luminosus]